MRKKHKGHKNILAMMNEDVFMQAIGSLFRKTEMPWKL